MKHIVISAIAAALTLGCSSTARHAPSEAYQMSDSAQYGRLLQGGEWVIADIGGRGVIDNSHASLHFSEDGHLSGSATCNKMLGSFIILDNRLTISPVGTTMMACPEALMRQERMLLDLLPEVQTYSIDRTGRLVLETKDGVEITAYRR